MRKPKLNIRLSIYYVGREFEKVALFGLNIFFCRLFFGCDCPSDGVISNPTPIIPGCGIRRRF